MGSPQFLQETDGRPYALTPRKRSARQGVSRIMGLGDLARFCHENRWQGPCQECRSYAPWHATAATVSARNGKSLILKGTDK